MADPAPPHHFIHQIIERDLASGTHQRIHTRFPPEPNGYLHIGHAKSIVLNFGLAETFGGRCNLRFDDTNPHKENREYVRAIQEDVHWLGYDWGDRLYFASDYFEQLYAFARILIQRGLAYVCDLSAEEIRAYRGTLKEPGRESPNRNRSVQENLQLFSQMREGAFPDGSRTLRAKIDMASPNINLRDPVLYRIKHGVVHHQTGTEWCLYPMYDFTHPLCDALEGITHSLCTLEFEDHRPLYEWVIDRLPVPSRPRQIEFSRLNLQYTVMSKRLLTRLVEEGHVAGWDDPRLPTLAGMRRRGYTPEAIRTFCHRIGITKSENRVEMSLLENTVREDLDARAPRRLAVLRPLRVILENYPEDRTEAFSVPNHPKDPAQGTRTLFFGRELYIDRNDFSEHPPPGFKRLVPGGEVRLRHAYVIRCERVIRDAQGEIRELRCRIDPETLGQKPRGRKVKGVIHWVAARHSHGARVRLYDRLFRAPIPGAESGDFLQDLNPDSLEDLGRCRVEAALGQAKVGERFQFEREGYFILDSEDPLVFNRTVALRDTWERRIR